MTIQMKKPRYEGKQRAALPQKFEPRIFAEADSRFAIVKEIRNRVERLKEEAACDSYQKQMLAERAIFMAIQLETLETNAAEGKTFAAGAYVLMVNCLQGLLAKLGLERQFSSELSGLQSYLGGKKRKQTKSRDTKAY